MSEKKPEIIYISGIAAKILVEKGVMWDNNTYTNDTTMHGVYYDIPYILKQTHDKEVEDLKAEIERLKGKEEYVCPNQCDWIGMFGGELCDECKKREQ
jgi:hypothetical protein